MNHSRLQTEEPSRGFEEWEGILLSDVGALQVEHVQGGIACGTECVTSEDRPYSDVER